MDDHHGNEGFYGGQSSTLGESESQRNCHNHIFDFTTRRFFNNSLLFYQPVVPTVGLAGNAGGNRSGEETENPFKK